MFSLFQREEKKQYSSTVTAPEPVASHELSEGTAPEETTRVALLEQTNNNSQKRQKAQTNKGVKTVLTAQQRAVRTRRLALVTLLASLALGGRWYMANLEPVYSQAGGFYPESIAPKWGEMKQPNAATFYMAAVDAFDTSKIYGDSRAVASKMYIMDQPVTVQRPLVERAQPAFALLRQGMQYPYYPDYQTNYFKSNPNLGLGLERPVPNLLANREIARLLAAEANVRAVDGNISGAMESSLDILRLGVDQGQGHTLVEGMIGILIQGIGAHTGMKYVRGLSATEARAATERLETILQREPTAAQMMTAQRDWTYESFQQFFKIGNLAGTNTGTDTESFLSGNIGRLVYNAALLGYTKQGFVDDYAHQMNTIIERVHTPYQQAKALPEIKQSKNPIIANFIVHYARVFQKSTANAASNQVLLGQLAVQAYRQEHNGTLPTSLSELTQGVTPYLTAVPKDALSLNGAEPLRYDPRTGNVYSVGENGLDDHNTGDDNGDLNRPL